MRKTKQSSDSSVYSLVRPVTTSSLVGAIISGILLFMLAFLLSIKDLPHAAIEPLALAAAIIGGIAAGFLCARLVRRRGLLLGALCGAGLFLILSIASFAVTQVVFDYGSLLKLAACVLSGAIGGVMGVNAKLYKK